MAISSIKTSPKKEKKNKLETAMQVMNLGMGVANTAANIDDMKKKRDFMKGMNNGN